MWKIKALEMTDGQWLYELLYYFLGQPTEPEEYAGTWQGCVDYMRSHKLSNAAGPNRIMIGG